MTYNRARWASELGGPSKWLGEPLRELGEPFKELVVSPKKLVGPLRKPERLSKEL